MYLRETAIGQVGQGLAQGVTVFVWTAILVGVAYMVWFFFFAGPSF